jgi:hypothetical protein
MPFVKTHLALAEGTDGIVLAYRFLQLAITTITALVGYAALRRWIPPFVAAAVGASVLVYMPFLLPVVGYGMDAHWHMLSSFSALLLLAQPSRDHRWYAGVGIISALGAIANPPTIIVLPFFMAALAIAHRGAGTQRARFGPVLWYAAGFAFAGLIFALALDAAAGHREFSLLRYVLHPDDHDFSLGAYVRRLLSSKWLGVMPIALGTSFAIVRRREGQASLLAPALVALSTLGVYALIATGRLTAPVTPQSLAFAAGASLLIALFRPDVPRKVGAVLVLVLPAMGAGAGWFLGSNAGIHTALLAAPLVLAAGLLFWSTRSPIGWAQLMSLVMLVAGIGAPGLAFTPEGNTLEMTSVVEDGPFEGMLGTAHEATLQADFVRALRMLPASGGRVLFLERFPLGYLIVQQRPGTYSTWATSATGERLQQFVDVTGDRPSRIVLTRYAFNVQDGEFPTEVRLTGFDTDFERVYADENLIVYDAQ